MPTTDPEVPTRTGSGDKGGAPTAGDVEDGIALRDARELDEALAEVLVIPAGELVIGRSGTIEHACDPGLGVVHDNDRTDPDGDRFARHGRPAPGFE